MAFLKSLSLKKMISEYFHFMPNFTLNPMVKLIFSILASKTPISTKITQNNMFFAFFTSVLIRGHILISKRHSGIKFPIILCIALTIWSIRSACSPVNMRQKPTFSPVRICLCLWHQHYFSIFPLEFPVRKKQAKPGII